LHRACGFFGGIGAKIAVTVLTITILSELLLQFFNRTIVAPTRNETSALEMYQVFCGVVLMLSLAGKLVVGFDVAFVVVLRASDLRTCKM